MKAAKLRAMRKQELTIKIIIIISNSNNNNDNNNKNNNTNNLKIDKEHTQTYILQFWPWDLWFPAQEQFFPPRGLTVQCWVNK